MFGLISSKMFAIKCLILSQTYKLLFITISCYVIMSSYILRILEGPYVVDNDGIDFTSYINCIWNILVTMTTSDT